MKFIEHADSIPNEILEAQQNNKLVIFVGAGVSVAPPSNLPDFVKLAQKLALGSSLNLEIDPNGKSKEPVDRFLGRLEDTRPQSLHWLQEQIATCFKEVTEPNELHKNILRLFGLKNIKIITTNFDNLLSIAAKQLQLDIKTYCAPALPLGDNFDGIVYLHGCINDEPKNLVATDKSFSQAYLCKGWASRFILDVFSNYTVLFIGYSYDDTVLNYLTRGIVSKDIYAIIPNGHVQDWQHLGIKTIKYNNDSGKHENIQLLLTEWGNYSNSNILDETSKIEKLAKQSPKNLDEFGISYIKEHIFLESYRVKLFLKNTSYTNDWLKWFDDNDFLKRIFYPNPKIILTEIDKEIINWFAEHFLEDENLYLKTPFGENDGIVQELLSKYNYLASDDLVWEVSRFFYDKINSGNIYATWVNIILNSTIAKENSTVYLANHLITCLKNGYKVPAIMLFEFLLDVNLNYRSNQIELNIKDYWLNKSDLKNTTDFFKDYSKKLAPILTKSLFKASYLLRNYYKQAQDSSHLSWNRLSIEVRNDEDHYDKDVNNIINLLLDCLDFLLEKDIDLARTYIIQYLESDIIVLNRIGIYGLYSCKIMNPNNVLNLFLDKEWLFNINLKHEVRHFLRLNYKSLEKPSKEKFIKVLSKSIEKKEYSEYLDIARFLRYIHDNESNANCPLLNKYYNQIKEKLDYPIDSIERDLDSHSWSMGVGGLVNHTWKISPEELLSWDISDINILNGLLEVKGSELIEDKIVGDSRDGVLEAVTKAVKEDINWGIKLTENLIKNNFKNCDLYNAIFRGFRDAEYNDELFEQQINHIFTLINSNLQFDDFDKYNTYSLNNFIEKILQNKKEKLFSANLVSTIKQALIAIWNAQNIEKDLSDDTFQQAINTIEGEAVSNLLRLLWIEYKNSNENVDVFNSFYAEFFENEIINITTFKAKMGLSILSNRIYFLHCFNKEWTENKLITKMDIDNPMAFIIWDGFLISSPQFPKAFIDATIEYFNKVIASFNTNFISKYKDRFCDFYLLMFISSLLFSNEDMNKFKIHDLVNKLSENELNHWYHNIADRLEDKVVKDNIELVHEWLWRYWSERILITSNPIEKGCWLNLILALQEDFPTCLEIIKRTNYEAFDEWIFYELKKSEIVKKYPKEVIEFLDHIVNDTSKNSIQYRFSELKAIIEKTMEQNKDSSYLNSLLSKLVKYGQSWAIELLRGSN